MINIKKLEKLKDLKIYKIRKITEKTCFDKIEFSNKLKNKNKVYFDIKKKIIKIKHQIRKYCKKNIEVIKKWSYLIKIKFNRITKNVLNFYIYFIRLNINLIIKMKQNFIFIKKIKTLNLSKSSQIGYKKIKINYE